MKEILNLISVTSAFVFGVGVFYFALEFTIGKIKLFQSRKIWNEMQIKDVIFLVIAVSVILILFDFNQPYH